MIILVGVLSVWVVLFLYLDEILLDINKYESGE